MHGGLGRIFPNKRETESKVDILILGINPSADSVVKKNSTLHRLAHWIDQLEIRDRHHFTNCILRPGNYDFRKVDYGRIIGLSNKYSKIVALGTFPSEVLRRLHIKHFRLPHPSPRNRQLNDSEYEHRVLNECYGYLFGEI